MGMTDSELRDAAVAHLKQTTTGYRKPNGQTKPPPWPEGSAHWKPALDLLEQIGGVTPPTGWPASYFTGPAGQSILLPPKKGVLVGAASGAPSSTTNPTLSVLEQTCGRRLDLEHRYWQDGYIDWNEVNAIVQRGHIPLISFLPTPRNGGQILRGDADAQLTGIGQQINAQPHKIMLRVYWEFNGYWYDFSRNIDGRLLSTDEAWGVWKRTVDKLKLGGAFPKASMVWCPHQGYYGRVADNVVDARSMTQRPEFDSYVDWVGADDYDFDSSRSFGRIFNDTSTYPAVAPDFRTRKPFLVGETSTKEKAGDPNYKANWWRAAGQYIETNMPEVLGFAAFDVNYTDGDWRVLSSTASGQGFRDMCAEPYFNT